MKHSEVIQRCEEMVAVSDEETKLCLLKDFITANTPGQDITDETLIQQITDEIRQSYDFTPEELEKNWDGLRAETRQVMAMRILINRYEYVSWAASAEGKSIFKVWAEKVRRFMNI